MKHGTASTYNNHGCRCIPCTDAQGVALQSWRSRRGRLGVHGPRQPRHGVRSQYVKGCRCDLCRAAETAYKRAYRAARLCA